MDNLNIEQQRERLLEEIKKFISEVIGEDTVEELDITEDSTFTTDLEMDSIEIVSFIERAKAKYGNEIDFTSWLSSMNLEELVNLKLGDVINYIIYVHNSNK